MKRSTLFVWVPRCTEWSKVAGSIPTIIDFYTVGPCRNRRQSLPVWPPTLLNKIPFTFSPHTLRWLGTVVTSHTASNRQAYTPVMSMLQKAVQSTHCTSCSQPSHTAYARTHTPSHVPPSHSHAHTIQCYCRHRFLFLLSLGWISLSPVFCTACQYIDFMDVQVRK